MCCAKLLLRDHALEYTMLARISVCGSYLHVWLYLEGDFVLAVIGDIQLCVCGLANRAV